MVGTVGSFRTGQPLAAALKLDYIPITAWKMPAPLPRTRSESLLRGAAGIYDIALAVGVEKLKDSGFSGLAVAEPRDLTSTRRYLPFPIRPAATRYFHQYDIPYEDGKMTLAQIAAKNHHKGTMSPKKPFFNEKSASNRWQMPQWWPGHWGSSTVVGFGRAAAPS
ncbi:MAG: hypothetical protein CM1200mP27_07490 [Chloroflexota bacterium]|nr:MAG: hypothetical protein CM1200mP27_07490 [Chloroflexota bacterium]